MQNNILNFLDHQETYSYDILVHSISSSKMLRVQVIPEVLRKQLSDGISAACLITTEGSLLSAVVENDSATPSITETTLAAVASSIWTNYSQG